MGRKKGGKNAPGHNAGGARKGAGRPRKDGSRAQMRERSETYDSVLQPESEDSEHDQHFYSGPPQQGFVHRRSQSSGERNESESCIRTGTLQEQPTETSLRMISMANIHPAFIPFLNIPHHIPLQISVNHTAHTPFPHGVQRPDHTVPIISPSSLIQSAPTPTESTVQSTKAQNDSLGHFASRQIPTAGASHSQNATLHHETYTRPYSAHSQNDHTYNPGVGTHDSRSSANAEQVKHSDVHEFSPQGQIRNAAPQSLMTRSNSLSDNQPGSDEQDTPHTHARVLVAEPQHHYPSPTTPRVSAPLASSPANIHPPLPTPPLQAESLGRPGLRLSSNAQQVAASNPHPHGTVFYMPNRQALQTHSHLPPPPPNTLSPSQMHYHYQPSHPNALQTDHSSQAPPQPAPQEEPHVQTSLHPQPQNQTRLLPQHSPPLSTKVLSPLSAREPSSQRTHLSRRPSTSTAFPPPSFKRTTPPADRQLPNNNIHDSQTQDSVSGRLQPPSNDNLQGPNHANLTHSAPLQASNRKAGAAPSRGRLPASHWQTSLPSPPSSTTFTSLSPNTLGPSPEAIQVQSFASHNPRVSQSTPPGFLQGNSSTPGQTPHQALVPAYQDHRHLTVNHRPNLVSGNQDSQTTAPPTQPTQAYQRNAGTSISTTKPSHMNSQSSYQQSCPSPPALVHPAFALTSEVQGSHHFYRAPYTLPPVQHVASRSPQRSSVSGIKQSESNLSARSAVRPPTTESRYKSMSYPATPPQAIDHRSSRPHSVAASETKDLPDLDDDLISGMSDGTGGRQRRRCAVCIQQNNHQYAYDCPGRGDRTLCVSVNEDGKLAAPRPYGLEPLDALRAPKSRRRNVTEVEESVSPPIKASPAKVVEQPHSIPTFPMVSPRITQKPSLAPNSSAESRVVILASGQSNKRKRRCAICVKQGRDGLECPGRGNRNLCSSLTRIAMKV